MRGKGVRVALLLFDAMGVGGHRNVLALESSSSVAHSRSRWITQVGNRGFLLRARDWIASPALSPPREGPAENRARRRRRGRRCIERAPPCSCAHWALRPLLLGQVRAESAPSGHVFLFGRGSHWRASQRERGRKRRRKKKEEEEVGALLNRRKVVLTAKTSENQKIKNAPRVAPSLFVYLAFRFFILQRCPPSRPPASRPCAPSPPSGSHRSRSA